MSSSTRSTASLFSGTSSHHKITNSATDVCSVTTAVNVRASNTDTLVTSSKNTNTQRQPNATSLHINNTNIPNETFAGERNLMDQENKPTDECDNKHIVSDKVPPLVKVGVDSGSCDNGVSTSSRQETVIPKLCTEDNREACENTLSFLRDSSQSGQLEFSSSFFLNRETSVTRKHSYTPGGVSKKFWNFFMQNMIRIFSKL